MTPTGDRWVVISGAGGAIGRELVAHFAAKGHPVLALDRTFDTSHRHSSVVVRTLDLSDEAQVQGALAEAIPAAASIALLVNTVGLIWNEPTLSIKGAKLVTHGVDSWRKVIEANLTAPFVVAAQVAARMARRGGGAIVNFSSMSWMAGMGGMAVYTASKSAMIGLTRSLARDYGEWNIRVNAVAPGWVRTERQLTKWLTPEGDKQRLAAQCLKRWVEPEDIARFCVFLASDDASACTDRKSVV